jgi:uncharacterized protein
VETRTVIAKALKAEGVEYLFCYPQNPMVDACTSEGIRPIISRMERTAINMADGYARVAPSGLGVCAVQDSAGSENAFSGVAQAYADSVPILVLPGHAGTRRQGVPPHFDSVVNYRAVTKLATRLQAPDHVDGVLRRAFTALRIGRPGPVLLEVPNDVAVGEVPERAAPYRPVAKHRSAPDPADVRRAISLLLDAERPVLLAGQGVLRSGACDALRRFAELLRIPVMTSMNGKSALAESHPLALGAGGVTTTGMVDRFLRQADLLVAVGSSLTDWWMATPLPRGCPIIQATIDERDLNKDHQLEHALLGDARMTLEALVLEAEARLAKGAAPTWQDPSAEIAATRDAWMREWMPCLTSDDVPLSPYRVIWDLMNTLDLSEAIVTHESGSPREQLAPFCQTTTAGSYIGWGNSTQLGFSLGLALGLKLAHPEKVVVNLMGDASAGMAAMELETAARNGIGTLTVILNNSVMGGYEYFMPLAAERHGAKSLTGDYSQVADALGAWSARVARPEEIAPAVARAIDVTRTGRPAVIEAVTREESRFSTFW